MVDFEWNICMCVRRPVSATFTPVLQWHIILGNPKRLKKKKLNQQEKALFAVTFERLKAVVLFRVAIKPTFLGLLSIWSISTCGIDYGLKMVREKELS